MLLTLIRKENKMKKYEKPNLFTQQIELSDIILQSFAISDRNDVKDLDSFDEIF